MLYSFPIISDILAHNGMLDKDAFDIEKLRISCKINLNPFFKNKTCVKDLSVVPTQKNETDA